MSDDPNNKQNAGFGNPLWDAWFEGQRQFMDAQQAFTPQPEQSNAHLEQAVKQAQEIWNACDKQAKDWTENSERFFANALGAMDDRDGIAATTLKRMLAPARFPDEIAQTMRRLVEGPEFIDIDMLERQRLRATAEWVTLRTANAKYSAVVGAAWSRAFATFSQDMASNPDYMVKGLRTVLDRWLKIANDELTQTQRSDDYLTAQRELLRAGAEYRLKERELFEAWCEARSVPTRTEIDELHRSVYELRGQVRELRQRMTSTETAVQSKAPAKKAATKSKPTKKTAPKPAGKQQP